VELALQLLQVGPGREAQQRRRRPALLLVVRRRRRCRQRRRRRRGQRRRRRRPFDGQVLWCVLHRRVGRRDDAVDTGEGVVAVAVAVVVVVVVVQRRRRRRRRRRRAFVRQLHGRRRGRVARSPARSRLRFTNDQLPSVNRFIVYRYRLCSTFFFFFSSMETRMLMTFVS